MKTPLHTWWNAHYIAAARAAYPDECAGHELAVGFKLTRKDGTTHGGYYWPLVNGDHDLPVLHEATAWDPLNQDSCPSVAGDGLCLIPQGQPIREATSGCCSFVEGIGHVLVYPADLALGAQAKKRAPWAIDVDAFDVVEMVRQGGVSPHLSRAHLSRANLSGADLSRADLYGADLSWANLSGADLSRADLSRADLYGANLSWANLSGADLSRADLYGAHLSGANHDASTTWPAGFKP